MGRNRWFSPSANNNRVKPVPSSVAWPAVYVLQLYWEIYRNNQIVHFLFHSFLIKSDHVDFNSTTVRHLGAVVKNRVLKSYSNILPEKKPKLSH